MLFAAGILLVIIGVVHSVLGERFILCRLFKLQNLPQLFGSDKFTKSTMRFAWHLTTVAWFAFASVLLTMALGHLNYSLLLKIISFSFFVSGLLSFGFTKGRHLSWIVFWSVSILTWVSSHAFESY